MLFRSWKVGGELARVHDDRLVTSSHGVLDGDAVVLPLDTYRAAACAAWEHADAQGSVGTALRVPRITVA